MKIKNNIKKFRAILFYLEQIPMLENSYGIYFNQKDYSNFYSEIMKSRIAYRIGTLMPDKMSKTEEIKIIQFSGIYDNSNYLPDYLLDKVITFDILLKYIELKNFN